MSEELYTYLNTVISDTVMTGNNVLMNIIWVVYEIGRQSGTVPAECKLRQNVRGRGHLSGQTGSIQPRKY
jgi:hypothetical protein